jgi:DNA-binding MarR family transcriptional regulator
MDSRDWTDGHVARWQPVLPGLDPDVEGAVTRMSRLTKHLHRVREQSLLDLDLQRHEYDTLHALAGRGGAAAPSELAADLDITPASVTGRLESLENRQLIRRMPSATDRRRVEVTLTDDGRAAWLRSMGVLGDEESRLLGVLDATERRALADLLRRIMLVAESRSDAPSWG